MNFKELVIKNRSFRRFDSGKNISNDELLDIVDTARLTPSGGNLQSMRFKVVNDPEGSEKVFSTLKWAAYLRDWDGPSIEERPVAYIILLRDNTINSRSTCDDGIVAQTAALAAAEKGIGCCMLLNCDSKKLFNLLNIDSEKYTFNIVLALGFPAEKVVLESVKDNNIKYWRDEQGVHHVPKRSLEEVLLP